MKVRTGRRNWWLFSNDCGSESAHSATIFCENARMKTCFRTSHKGPPLGQPSLLRHQTAPQTLAPSVSMASPSAAAAASSGCSSLTGGAERQKSNKRRRGARQSLVRRERSVAYYTGLRRRGGAQRQGSVEMAAAAQPGSDARQ